MRTSGFDGAYKTASGYRMKTGDNSRILEILAATGLSFLAAGWCFLNGINDSENIGSIWRGFDLEITIFTAFSYFHYLT